MALLPAKIKQSLQQKNLFKSGQTIIVGVSGGMDSVALIHLLHELQHDLGILLHIAHYNHNLRKDSKKDQVFVEELAARLNLPCSVGQWKKTNQTRRGSIEELARINRFAYFVGLSKTLKTDIIALAHTKDDLAETVLMRLLRGTGLQGLRGILPSRKMYQCQFIRPLLDVNKKDIEKYLKHKHIDFRADPSNADTVFFRNDIRQRLLPHLEKNYNPKIKETLTNLSNQISTDYNYIYDQAAKRFEKLAVTNKSRRTVAFSLKWLNREHPSIQRMLLRLAIEQLKGNTNQITLKHMQEIENLLDCRPSQSVVNLPSGVEVKKTAEFLTLYRRKACQM